MSGANTLTFSEIQTNTNVFDKTAWVISRIEWFFSQATRALMLAADDTLTCALTFSQGLTSLALSNPAVIDLFQYEYGFQCLSMPIIRDFSTFPGGGIIVAARPLFIAMTSTSIASAASSQVRFNFTMKELAADEYLELVDFYRIVS